MDRRIFLDVLAKSLGAGLTASWQSGSDIMTVSGPIGSGAMGVTLIHEHIMVDFIGAQEVGSHRYLVQEVINRALPFLLELKDQGCKTFVDCTPAYLGRDASVLKQLSELSGVQIITNTGYYGAVAGKYLPDHAFVESSTQLSERWIEEWNHGIEGTGVFPGFIKIGVNKGPLNAMDRKLVEAAALTHKRTGLSISSHTGDGLAALEQIRILEENSVNPEAFRWVHAQNEKDMQIHLQAALQGAWVEFDGIGEETAEEHIAFILNMKEHNLLGKCLISQDSGWYHVGEENGGNFRPFTYIWNTFMPQLKKHGISKKEINKLVVENPKASLEIRIKLK